MPVTQEPTLNPIDLDHNQFEVQFGVEMIAGESTIPVSIPNIGQTAADFYTIDFTKVQTPARGNFPAFRCLQFVLETHESGGGAAKVGTVYIVNPRTNQLIAVLAPAPSATSSSVVFACVPFFAKSNQSVLLYREISANSVARLSATAYTFDCSSFYAVNNPNS
jgi:hypothetical protein